MLPFVHSTLYNPQNRQRLYFAVLLLVTQLFLVLTFKVHVSDGTGNTDGFMTTIRSPLSDHRKVYAMDCEMVQVLFTTLLSYPQFL